MSDQTPQILFQEVQRFRQAFLWIPLTLLTSFVSGTTIFIMVRQLVQGIPFENGALTDGQLLALGSMVIAFNAVILLFFGLAKMQTEVTADGLFVRFLPFHRKTRQISLDHVESVAAVEYRALLEYGGYGIRRYPRSTAYNVRGIEGVRINYDNGCHVMIGTQHPDELFAAVKTVLEYRED